MTTTPTPSEEEANEYFDFGSARAAHALRGWKVLIVEGASDRLALQALARRLGRNLEAEGIAIVPIGGAHAVGRFLRLVGPQGLNLKVAGLCDAREEGEFRRGLERAGMGSNLTRAEMEALGFYVCEADLEDELIRSLGVASIERILGDQGELSSFRKFQRQPAQHGRPVEAQMRRFMGTRSGRKAKYARVLVDALELSQVPRPFACALRHLQPAT